MIRPEEYARLLEEAHELEQKLRDRIQVLTWQLAQAQSDCRYKDYLIMKKEEEIDASKNRQASQTGLG